MKRLYLSGKITGTDDYMLRFAAAEKRFERDYEIINPAKTSATLPELRHCCEVGKHQREHSRSIGRLVTSDWRSYTSNEPRGV